MILKKADSKEADIAELERLLRIASPLVRPKIEQELRNFRAGIKGEQESAYLIDFDYRDSQRMVVIHDLRLDLNGRVAQIDHLLIHRTMNVFVLESKHLHAGMEITEEGEFKKLNTYKKTWEGMASPLAQNDRHIAVLKDAFETMNLPERAGIKLNPTFHSYVLVSPSARIDRPNKFDSSHVIKADDLLKTIKAQFESAGLLDTVASLARFVSYETIEEIGKKLIRRHRPKSINYAAKFGIAEPEASASVAASVANEMVTEPLKPENIVAAASCQECGVEVDKKVVYFCRINKAKFNGQVLCRECQQIPAI